MKSMNIKKKDRLHGNDFLRIGKEYQSINDWIRNDSEKLFKTLNDRKIYLEYKSYKDLLEKII